MIVADGERCDSGSSNDEEEEQTLRENITSLNNLVDFVNDTEETHQQGNRKSERGTASPVGDFSIRGKKLCRYSYTLKFVEILHCKADFSKQKSPENSN